MMAFAAQIGVLPTASDWLVQLVTGSLATSIAILAIAFIGFGMLRGRIDMRRGATTLIGCFILFGAPAIAAALSDLARDDPSTAAIPTEPSIDPVANAPTVPKPQSDPYAGAALVR